MVIKTVYHTKKEALAKYKGGILEVVLHGRWVKWLTLVSEGFVWWTRCRGKLYRLTIKWTSSKTVVKDFPCTLRALYIDSFKSIKPQKMDISQKLVFFLSPFSVMRHNSSVVFHLKLYMPWTKRAHQSANFQTCDWSHEK